MLLPVPNTLARFCQTLFSLVNLHPDVVLKGCIRFQWSVSNLTMIPRGSDYYIYINTHDKKYAHCTILFLNAK